MATHFEVVNKLRDLGKSFDKVSNILPADGVTEETNKARACLQLKALLTEAKNFKKEVTKSIADAKEQQTLDSVLAMCEKQAYKIREDIENLEDHLTKYGYKQPGEKLPEISLDSTKEFDSESGDLYKSESPGSSSSDKENHSPRSEREETVESEEKAECSNLGVIEQNQQEEVDLLVTPVRPKTFTKFINNLDPQEENPTSPDALKEPLRPVTATPLLQSLKNFDENSGFSTPESLELPTRPVTQTPMIKADINFDSPPTDGRNEEDSLVDDFPTPPTFATPGLKCRSKANDVESPRHYDDLKTPPPPNVTSVRLLKPDDFCCTVNAPEGKLKEPVEFEKSNKNTYHFPDIDLTTYQRLPDSVQPQISFEQFNHLIRQTEKYLNKIREESCGIVTTEELRSALHSGPLTKIFALGMVKVGYFSIERYGIYSTNNSLKS